MCLDYGLDYHYNHYLSYNDDEHYTQNWRRSWHTHFRSRNKLVGNWHAGGVANDCSNSGLLLIDAEQNSDSVIRGERVHGRNDDEGSWEMEAGTWPGLTEADEYR